MIKIWLQRKYNNFILRNILAKSGWILTIISRKHKIILTFHTLSRFCIIFHPPLISAGIDRHRTSFFLPLISPQVLPFSIACPFIGVPCWISLLHRLGYIILPHFPLSIQPPCTSYSFPFPLCSFNHRVFHSFPFFPLVAYLIYVLLCRTLPVLALPLFPIFSCLLIYICPLSFIIISHVSCFGFCSCHTRLVFQTQRWTAALSSVALKCIPCKILPFCERVIFREKRRKQLVRQSL